MGASEITAIKRLLNQSFCLEINDRRREKQDQAKP
jgi:hypothetical protein